MKRQNRFISKRAERNKSIYILLTKSDTCISKIINLTTADRYTHVSISFDDLIFSIHLEGKLVRIEEHEQYIVYGFVILNVNNDLPVYINQKQRKNRKG